MAMKPLVAAYRGIGKAYRINTCFDIHVHSIVNIGEPVHFLVVEVMTMKLVLKILAPMDITHPWTTLDLIIYMKKGMLVQADNYQCGHPILIPTTGPFLQCMSSHIVVKPAIN